MKPFVKSHRNYERLVLVENEGAVKSVICADKAELDRAGPAEFQAFTAFARGTVAPQLYDMLQCAPLMYQQLTKQYNTLERLSEVFEMLRIPDGNPVVQMVDESKQTILLVQQAARDGIMPTSEAINREEERKFNGRK